MTPKSAVALLSSGLDSAVALRLAQAQGWTIALALTFDYGQRAARRELAQAKRLSDRFGIAHQTLELPWLRSFKAGGALLTERTDLPRPDSSQLGDKAFTEASAKAVWVPNRNGLLIEIAAGFAEDLGADAVIVGFNREEGETFPDNSVPYLNALTKALSFSTANHVRLLSPTSNLDKTEIVRAAAELNFPFDLLWSCYESSEKMCGRCESCMRLKRALNRNGVAFDAYFENAALS